MGIKSLLKLLKKFKWVLILVPIIAVTITYFLVRNLPKQYNSEVQISTGLLDPSKKLISNETTDFFQVSQQFNSIIEKIKMKKMINILSYNLILHDLEQPKVRFRKYSELIESFNSKQRNEIITMFRKKLAIKAILTLADNDGKYKLYDIVSSMGYGEDALRKQADVSHADNSDFIKISYTSENPELSAYLVNTFATIFISNYSNDVSMNQTNSIVLLDSVLKQKEIVMNQKNEALATFKRNKGVLNLSEQSAAVYGQITEYESQRANAIRQIQTSQGQINIINSKLGGADVTYNGSSRANNRELVNLKQKLVSANNAFIENGFKPADQKKIDSLNRIILSMSNQNSDDNVVDPKASKQSLISQKLVLELSLEQAKSSMSSINAQLAQLRAKYSSMVPYDADIQNYEREADLATKDYTTASEQYSQSKAGQSMGLRLQIEQIGLPGNPQPSKRIIYLAGAGFGSFALCAGFILIMFLTDNKIRSMQQLAAATKSNTLGALCKIESDERNIREIWNEKGENVNYEFFRDMLRSLRFEVTEKLDADESKIIGVTSLVAGEGKTFVCHSLAYAFAMTGKKVLLIADELPVVKATSTGLVVSHNFQTFLVKKEIHTEDLITIMNKNTARESLLEMQSVRSLKAGFDVLRKEFDIIIVDVNSLHDINIAKEWLLFTEKNIAVFEYGKSIQDVDKEFVVYIRKLPGFLGWVLNKTEIIN